MNDRDRFYHERDRRTLEYGVRDVFDVPVAVVVGPQAAGCLRGQMAALSLVNMLARVHRSLHLEVPSVPVLQPGIVPGSTLDVVVRELARSIDPFIQLEVPESPAFSIGLGADAPADLTWYVGAERQIAIISTSPVPFDTTDSPSLGAGLSACLAAGTALRHILGESVRPLHLSAWNLGEGHGASPGPEVLGPLDVGRVLQVGAGGVGNCLDYWLREFGVRGLWDIVDGDDAVLHNTNRSLGLFPYHTSWSGNPPWNKAKAAACLFGARPMPQWYEELDANAGPYDLVLPLANERAVRHHVACRGEPIVLHATTSRTWEAQLHRHMPDRDDCIVCRMPTAASDVHFECASVSLNMPSEASLEPATSSDAALPFLSAAAGLLLLSGLFRLQDGVLPTERHNLWALAFSNPRCTARRAIHAPCGKACGRTVHARVRQRIHAGRRWSNLDVAVRQDASV